MSTRVLSSLRTDPTASNAHSVVNDDAELP